VDGDVTNSHSGPLTKARTSSQTAEKTTAVGRASSGDELFGVPQ